MKDKLTIGKNELSIDYDFSKILKALDELKEDYEEDEFVELGYREFDDLSRIYLTQSEYIENIDKVIAKVNKLQNVNMVDFISTFPKKKNGTFNRKSKIVVIDCDNSYFNGDYCGRWDYRSLKIIAIDDTHLECNLFDATMQESGF